MPSRGSEDSVPSLEAAGKISKQGEDTGFSGLPDESKASLTTISAANRMAVTAGGQVSGGEEDSGVAAGTHSNPGPFLPCLPHLPVHISDPMSLL